MKNQPTTMTTSKILTNNLLQPNKARQVYIASESSERTRRALNHNIRTSGDTKYVTGDNVYLKRFNE